MTDYTPEQVDDAHKVVKAGNSREFMRRLGFGMMAFAIAILVYCGAAATELAHRAHVNADGFDVFCLAGVFAIACAMTALQVAINHGIWLAGPRVKKAEDVLAAMARQTAAKKAASATPQRRVTPTE